MMITSDEVRQAVNLALADPDSASVIKKVMDGNSRPIMSLVGKVMKSVNRRGDPVVIKKLLEEGIAERQRTGGSFTAAADKKEDN